MDSIGDTAGELRAVPDGGSGRDVAAEPDPEPDSSLTIEVATHAGDWSGLDSIESRMAAAASAISVVMGRATCGMALSVALSSDDEVRKLNATWRGRDSATNVLSFPSTVTARTPDGRRFLGDVVLAAETVRREAADSGIAFAHHATHLIVHGVLHLLGFDHENAEDADQMEAREIAILNKLGISDPYQ